MPLWFQNLPSCHEIGHPKGTVWTVLSTDITEADDPFIGQRLDVIANQAEVGVRDDEQFTVDKEFHSGPN